MKKIALLLITIALPVLNAGAQVINSTWLGNGSLNYTNGNWSDPSLWNPTTVPNNTASNLYDVVVNWDPLGQQFNGPELDLNVTVRNLTLVNRVFLDNQAFPGTNLTVTGTTTMTTTSGHDGEYAVIFFAGGTLSLGNLANYNAATHTLEAGFLFPLNGGTIQFRGADIMTNNGDIVVGDGSQLLNQDNGQVAYVHFAVNNGGFTLGGGHSFSTALDFTNNGSLALGGAGNATFTITGSLTNFDQGSGSLTGGTYVVDGTQSTATLRFTNANIRMLFGGADVRLLGPNSFITDLQGHDAAFTQLRNIEGGSSLTIGRTLTVTPFEGTLYNLGGHIILTSGANLTINGEYQQGNGGTLTFNPDPNPTADTVVTMSSHLTIGTGGTLDLGGQPGVDTQYHTELHVMNGIEFRGAYLTGAGTTFADIGLIQGSVLNPGHSPGQIVVNGALTLASDTTTYIQLAGLTPGDEFDQVTQHGPKTVTLGGTLDLSFLNGFENTIQHSDVFDVVTSDNILAGGLSNVASDDRLTTDDSQGSFKVTYAGQKTLTLSEYQAFPKLISVVSRLTHGTQGDFDLPVAISGSPSIESRASDSYQLIFTFNNNLVDAKVNVNAPSGGSIDDTSVSDNTVIVNLSGVANVQKLTFSLSSVQDEFSQIASDTQVQMYVLVGDANRDGYVNAADATVTRNLSGHVTDATNYRLDFNHDGTVNVADSTITRAHSGSSIVGLNAAKARRALVR